MKFFVAGGNYPRGDKVEFVLISPTGGLPYAWPESHPLDLDATALHNLTKHHASLYEVLPDGKSLKLVSHGECRLDPRSPTLNDQQAAQVAQAVAQTTSKLTAARPEPETECPNCHNGTVALEHNRLVCRGECGNDFGPAVVT
jgi:hypothetical protein